VGLGLGTLVLGLLRHPPRLGRLLVGLGLPLLGIAP
jgi:hypothetical protein